MNGRSPGRRVLGAVVTGTLLGAAPALGADSEPPEASLIEFLGTFPADEEGADWVDFLQSLGQPERAPPREPDPDAGKDERYDDR
jgi:hypothetical protein